MYSGMRDPLRLLFILRIRCGHVRAMLQGPLFQQSRPQSSRHNSSIMEAVG
jgi:hypothetical protein